MEYPKPSERFRFEDLRKLPLGDVPYLCVYIDCGMFPVQTSHCTDEQIMQANPKWRDSLWQYNRTTEEDIPLFSFVGDDAELRELIDFEQYIDKYFPEQGTVYWVTPKGCPRSREE